MLGERLKQIRQGQNPELLRIEPIAFSGMVKEYLEVHAKQKKSYPTYKQRTDRFRKYFKGTLQQIRPRDIQDYIACRLDAGVDEATVNR